MPDTLMLSIISTGVRVSTCSLARQIACLILATFCIAIPILTLVAWGWLVCCSFSYLKGGSEFDSAFEASAAAINNMYQDAVTTIEYHEKTEAAVAPAATRTKSRRARIIHRTKHNRIFRYLFSGKARKSTTKAEQDLESQMIATPPQCSQPPRPRSRRTSPGDTQAEVSRLLGAAPCTADGRQDLSWHDL